MEIYYEGDKLVITQDNKRCIRVPSQTQITEDYIRQVEQHFEEMKQREQSAELELQYPLPIPHLFTIAQWIREYRNRLLSESDWTQLPDAPLREEERQAWKDYRQALRDLPQTWGLSPVGTMPETSKVNIDLSVVKTKEDVEKLPLPEKPK